MQERISTEVDGVTLTLSNLDKPIFPSGFTKGELISYYVEVAEVMLPHLADRAVTRVRFPNGTAAQSFFEKNAPAGSPAWVKTMDVATSAGAVNYVVADDRATLAWLANLAAVELHTPPVDRRQRDVRTRRRRPRGPRSASLNHPHGGPRPRSRHHAS